MMLLEVALCTTVAEPYPYSGTCGAAYKSITSLTNLSKRAIRNALTNLIKTLLVQKNVCVYRGDVR
jgi:hypothetical protein